MRIENRYIPAGPSVKDEVANTMFWVGLMQGMPDRYKDFHLKMSFNEVKGNFINAARTGINTFFNWFGKGLSAKKLILSELLPIAYGGLVKSGVALDDIQYYLNIIEKRTESRCTGAEWIRDSNRHLKSSMTKNIANATITAHMYNNQKEGKPVHEWKKAREDNVLNLNVNMSKLDKFMTTEVFVVKENDLVELVAKIMEWKNIHHIPVVNDLNKVTGIITNTNLRDILGKDQKLIVAKDIMIKEIITVDSETSIEKANSIMLENKIGCFTHIRNG